MDGCSLSVDGRSVDGRSVDGRSLSVDGRSALSTGGMNIVSPRRPRKGTSQTTQSDLAAKSLSGMTLEEMQAAHASALADQLMPPGERQNREKEVKSARSILEANKQLIEEKQQQRARARLRSREFIDKILDDDRRTLEAEKMKEVNKRNARAELAQYYKFCIGQKEAEKANSYREKLRHGIDDPHFPFTEGEDIMSARKAQRAEMQSEMQDFLRRQLQENPPRPNQDESRGEIAKYELSSPLKPRPNVEETRGKYEASSPGRRHKRPDDAHAASQKMQSPISPSHKMQSSLSPSQKMQSPMSPSAKVGTADLIEAGLSKPHHCLQKSQEYPSRRVEDTHVRSVLERTVQNKKEQLETLAKERLAEVEGMKEGMMVNDALRYDSNKWRQMEYKRNAEFVREQMKERQVKDERALQEYRAECHGYWGPEEKPIESKDKFIRLSEDLIKQMEVDQNRRIHARDRRLKQEQRLINNSLAEIQHDRSNDQKKLEQHKEVLVKTWANQQTIKAVQEQIESYSYG